MQFVLAWLLVAALPAGAPDTLVVCPAALRDALAPWEIYRREQGHVLAVVEPPRTASDLRAIIRQTASLGRLKSVVLIGDVPAVPTNYVDAQVNVLWGSEPTIATDEIYAEIDGDQVPDVAVGRMPVHSPAELTAVIRKILCYEQQADQTSWRRRIDLVAGVGGFGAVADAVIEAAGRRVIESSVPASFEVHAISASPASALCPPPDQFTACVCRQMSTGAFAWIYMGHGLPTQLDAINTAHGPRPILAVDDVAQLRCGAGCPLAVLIACYTGAFDARSDCLAERLLACEQGPVAVVAATRVTMPYGNTVFGNELLHACFNDHPSTLGELWTLAQRRALAEAPKDDLRMSLDLIARTLTPPRNQESVVQSTSLAAERREHVLMYQLLGDPLLRLQFPHEMRLSPLPPAADGDRDELIVEGHTDVAGSCTLEVLPASAAEAKSEPLTIQSSAVPKGSFQMRLAVPHGASGSYSIRGFVTGENACAVGATTITLPQRSAASVSRAASTTPAGSDTARR